MHKNWSSYQYKTLGKNIPNLCSLVTELNIDSLQQRGVNGLSIYIQTCIWIFVIYDRVEINANNMYNPNIYSIVDSQAYESIV